MLLTDMRKKGTQSLINSAVSTEKIKGRRPRCTKSPESECVPPWPGVLSKDWLDTTRTPEIVWHVEEDPPKCG